METSTQAETLRTFADRLDEIAEELVGQLQHPAAAALLGYTPHRMFSLIRKSREMAGVYRNRANEIEATH